MKKVIILILAMLLFIVSCNPTGNVVLDSNDSCAKFQGPAKDNCYLESNQCSKISSTLTRDSCIAQLALLKDDIIVCDLINDITSRGYCKEEIAVANNDQEICGKIVNQYWKDNCNYNLALNNNEYEFCTLVIRSEQRFECVETIALETNNHELCVLLSPDQTNSCLHRIAVNLKEFQICQEIDNGILRDACRRKVAKAADNPEICDYIGAEFIKQSCLEQFA